MRTTHWLTEKSQLNWKKIVKHFRDLTTIHNHTAYETLGLMKPEKKHNVGAPACSTFLPFLIYENAFGYQLNMWK
jgi:hypothetical protein